MLLAVRYSDDACFAAVVVLVVLSGLGRAVWVNRHRVRWPVHAAAAVISLELVPPVSRPTVSAVALQLSALGFDLVVVTRARRTVTRGVPTYWYRAAALNRQTAEGACIDWWYQPERRSAWPAWISDVSVSMFRYGGSRQYTKFDRRVAEAARADHGRWSYVLLSDEAYLAAQRDALRDSAGDAPASPFPFSDTAHLVRLIESDSDRQIAAALARTTELDRSGFNYISTWRAAFLNALRLRRGRPAVVSAGRGFAVTGRDPTSGVTAEA